MKQKSKMNSAQVKLVEENMGLISRYICHHYFLDSRFADMGHDDLRQIGYLALCKAALNFDLTLPPEDFPKYANAAIYNELATCFRKRRDYPCTVSMDVLTEEYGDVPFSAPNGEEMFQLIENRDLLERHLKKLSGIYRTGLEAILLQMRGYTNEEIGRRYGKNHWYINAVISKTRKKLRTDPDLQEALCA